MAKEVIWEACGGQRPRPRLPPAAGKFDLVGWPPMRGLLSLCLLLVTCECEVIKQETRLGDEVLEEEPVIEGTGHLRSSEKETEDDSPPPPNIVVLLADDLGYGDLSFSGHPTSRTPEIDKLARESLFFTHHYVTSPICSPSRASLLTGRLQVRNGVYPGTFTPMNYLGLPRNETTIATLLKDKGYRTMLTGKWHLGVGREGEYLPIHHGFDHYLGLPYSHDMCPCPTCFPGRPCHDNCWGGTRVSCPLYSNGTIVEQPVDLLTLTSRLVQTAVTFMADAAASRKPFFLYFPFFHVHHPQFSPEKFVGKSLRGTIGDSLYELDWAVGQVVKALRQHHLLSSTLIWFSSDNGSKEVQSGHQPASEEGIPSGYGRVAWRRGDGESPASLVTLPGAAGCGYVMCQRGGGVARSTPNITSLGVWRTMRAALPSRPLSSPPPAGWAAGAGAVAGQNRSPSLTRHERGGCAGLLRCGKGTTWEGGVRVPLFVHWPSRVSPGRSDGLVSAVDLLPTVASLTGLNTSHLTLDGVDISPLLWDPLVVSPRKYMPIYPTDPTPKVGPHAVTNGTYKAHFYTSGSDLSDADNYDPMCPASHPLTKHDPPLLFNVHHDPGERYDLSADPQYSGLLRAFTAWRKDHMEHMTWDIPRTTPTDPRAQPCCTAPSCAPFPQCCDCPAPAPAPQWSTPHANDIASLLSL
ncbi:Arylsulfatase A [Chionoecetes opilio]|uniref:Arylsulfatase A n=1 Tax=Chionoecetes opilio TaxID=41210 RepID=A0A8J8WFB5_CHIOP|nr:Arylsulfatase A [Chionoecetes opilio]